ncbi:hypothetical protein PC113_g24770, partial [Phytophthora cactorum]
RSDRVRKALLERDLRDSSLHLSDCFSISLVTQVRRFFFTASPGILLVSLACARWRVRPEGRCVVLESCRFLRTRWITNS